MIGFIPVSLTFIRSIAKYYAAEASPAIEIASKSLGKGLKKIRTNGF